jgi:hypothetical protein
MLKIDRKDPGDTGFDVHGTRLLHVYPKESEITGPQAAWIADYMRDFVDALEGPGFDDPERGYARYIDVGAWIDHHILNVLAKNVDALRLSTHMHKARNGRLAMGPIWDFDRSMDSRDDRDDDPRGWSGSRDATDFLEFSWWGRLFEDAGFRDRYRDRWAELRRGPLRTERVRATIASLASEVAEAEERNFERWPLHRRGGLEGEVGLIDDWLSARLEWLDEEIDVDPGSEPPDPPDPVGGRQLPGDVDQSLTLEIADAIVILAHLFTDTALTPPCGDDFASEGNRALLDFNADGRLDPSDVVRLLSFLFARGAPHALGAECTEVRGCPSLCDG